LHWSLARRPFWLRPACLAIRWPLCCAASFGPASAMRTVFGSLGMMTSVLLTPDGKTGHNRQ
jgi:hypothetical protein